MDDTRQTARAIAEMTSEAYRCDVVTGHAPGITLADLIETAIRERDEKHAEEQESQRDLTRAAAQRAEARVAELEAALRMLHPERLDFDAHSDECLECRSSYSCDSDMEPTPECHQCAHAVLERARIAARRALEVEP